MEDAWVLPVRMCNRRDAIPPINIEFSVFVRYSRLSLSRTSRDLIKMFELSVVRDNQTVTS